MECSCKIDCYGECIDEEIIDNRKCEANREKDCSECKGVIQPGEKHIYIRNYNGRYRSCEDCSQLIYVFFDDWPVCGVRGEIKAAILFGDLDISEDCIKGLTDRNMEFICNLVEETWEE